MLSKKKSLLWYLFSHCFGNLSSISHFGGLLSFHVTFCLLHNRLCLMVNPIQFKGICTLEKCNNSWKTLYTLHREHTPMAARSVRLLRPAEYILLRSSRHCRLWPHYIHTIFVIFPERTEQYNSISEHFDVSEKSRTITQVPQSQSLLAFLYSAVCVCVCVHECASMSMPVCGSVCWNQIQNWWSWNISNCQFKTTWLHDIFAGNKQNNVEWMRNSKRLWMKREENEYIYILCRRSIS